MSNPKRRVRIQLVPLDPTKDPKGEALNKTRNDLETEIHRNGLANTSIGDRDSPTPTAACKLEDDKADSEYYSTKEDNKLRERAEELVKGPLEEIGKALGDRVKATVIATESIRNILQDYATDSMDALELVNRESAVITSELLSEAVASFKNIKQKYEPLIVEYARELYNNKLIMGVAIIKIAEWMS